MKSFLEFIIEAGGEAAGSLEVHRISLETAREYADKAFQQHQHKSLDQVLPKFNDSFRVAQRLANEGFTQRKDMPVIDEKDIKDLQRRLTDGSIDLNPPYAEDNKNDPFPKGISRNQADKWLNDGLPQFDKGPKTDDCVRASERRIAVGDLHPIQKQIYFDKSINATAKNGVDGTKNFLGQTHFVVSSDNRIIDGHHRWLSGILIDPQLPVLCLVVDLPISKLLPMTLTYSDAVGNTRNA